MKQVIDMKKFITLFLCLILVVGCGEKKNRNTNENNSGSNVVEEQSNTNSNSSSNVDTNSNSNPDEGKYTVHLYLFHLSTCEHCQAEKEWLKTIENDYPYLKIHQYEVKTDSAIYNKVVEALDIKTEYVPLTFIGDDYFTGFSTVVERKFIRTIKEMSTLDLCDIVGTAIQDGDVDACIRHNEQLRG